ncbi:MAG: PP2C family protein-serine/threonine phosphatase [Spirochaetes bacterium]|nr:PP2C family protein-serine/threonine phosphatase [Spirochaetota bacterium]
MKGSNPDRELMEQYRAFLRKKNIRIFRVIAALELLLLPLLTAFDCTGARLPAAAIALRSLPVPFAAALLAVALRGKGTMRFFVPLFHAFLLSNTIMLCGLMIMSMRTPHFSGYGTELIIAVLLILILSNSGARVLLPLYLIPAIPSFAYMIYAAGEPYQQPVLLNTGILLLASLAGSWLMERLRFSEFSAGLTIDATQREIDTEMELARRVQQNIIPQTPPESRHCRVYTKYIPVKEMGGDFFDFLNFKEQRALGIFISDVSGHGFHSALITSMLKSLLVTSGINRLSPRRLLEYLNSALKSLVTEHFITAFYGIFDNETNNLTFARAGHPYPLLIRGGGITMLKSRGAPLGPFVDGGYEEERVEMRSGDKILFYTDGLIEITDPQGELFESRMHDIIREHSGRGIGEIVDSIHEGMRLFSGSARFPDDICMVGIEILPGEILPEKILDQDAAPPPADR